ncbi:MAG TPA: nuclear transport factor 2 family protein [Xanthomonadales bacterium]
MSKNLMALTLCSVVFMGNALASEPTGLDELRQQVMDTESAFAQTMAQRDFEGFVSFLSEETVFFSDATALRGRQVVADTWKSYYEQAEAPFSWRPELVEVLDSGTLALSSGPVFDPEGKQVATFNSIWRLEAPGQWRIIFDKGSVACDCSQP